MLWCLQWPENHQIVISAANYVDYFKKDPYYITFQATSVSLDYYSNIVI